MKYVLKMIFNCIDAESLYVRYSEDFKLSYNCEEIEATRFDTRDDAIERGINLIKSEWILKFNDGSNISDLILLTHIEIVEVEE
jgi:hypothetical protein